MPAGFRWWLRNRLTQDTPRNSMWLIVIARVSYHVLRASISRFPAENRSINVNLPKILRIQISWNVFDYLFILYICFPFETHRLSFLSSQRDEVRRTIYVCTCSPASVSPPGFTTDSDFHGEYTTLVTTTIPPAITDVISITFSARGTGKIRDRRDCSAAFRWERVVDGTHQAGSFLRSPRRLWVIR